VAGADLQGMGGLAPVVALLGRQHPPALQERAAHVLGTAASNNHRFMGQLLGDHPEALRLLLQLVGAHGGSEGSLASDSRSSGGSGSLSGGDQAAATEAGIKALYALSAILRLHAAARDAFCQMDGMQALQALLHADAADVRLKHKALGLLTDMIHAEQQQQDLGLDLAAAAMTALRLLERSSRQAAKGSNSWSSADVEADLDLQEKALLALLAALDSQQSASVAAAVARYAEVGGAATLARLQASLQDVAAEQSGDEYLLELAELAGKVQAKAAAKEAGAQAAASLGSHLHDASEL
jgi:nucleotide exchange factor SIL1